MLETRRRRTRAEKEAILADLKAPGAKVSAVARRHNVAPSLVFRWRKELEGEAGKATVRSQGFVPVLLAAGDCKEALRAGSGVMEIELHCGARIRVDGSVDTAALKRVIAALERR